MFPPRLGILTMKKRKHWFFSWFLDVIFLYRTPFFDFSDISYTFHIQIQYKITGAENKDDLKKILKKKLWLWYSMGGKPVIQIKKASFWTTIRAMQNVCHCWTKMLDKNITKCGQGGRGWVMSHNPKNFVLNVIFDWYRLHVFMIVKFIAALFSDILK